MEHYDFTTMPDRRGRDAIAVDLQENNFWTLPQGETKPGFDKIPMWIADMNFPTAPCVTQAIMQRAAHPIYGYFVPSDEYYGAIIRWQRESFGVTDLTRQNIGYENGVLGGITSALQVLDPAHAPVLVHSPPTRALPRSSSATAIPSPSARCARTRPAFFAWTTTIWSGRSGKSTSTPRCSAPRTIPAAASGSAGSWRRQWSCSGAMTSG